MIATNPFVILSYVGGPALLTNATSLFVLSSSNRFALAIEAARAVAERCGDGRDEKDELRDTRKRVDLLVRALASFNVAAAMFSLGTLASIAGAAIAEIQNARILLVVIGGAAIVGVAGFIAFVTGTISLVFEARLIARIIARESRLALIRAGHA